MYCVHYTKHFKTFINTVIITLIKLETRLKVYLEAARYLAQVHIYISQWSQKYLNSRLSIILMSLDIQRDRV